MDIDKIGPGNIVYATPLFQSMKLRGNENKLKIIKALVLTEKEHIPSSDGEEWWLQWRVRDLETAGEFYLNTKAYDIELAS